MTAGEGTEVGGAGTEVGGAGTEVGGAVARRRRSRGGLDRDRSPSGVPPVSKPPWEMQYIPVYFWLGGIAGGAWLAAALEDVAGSGDRDVVRAARYISAGSTALGSALLVADLGRPERFLNMLRVIRPSSAMSLGAWGLAAFGGVAGTGAALQLAEDGGVWPFAGWSRGVVGRLLHVAGVPLGLFVGSYTGVLLSSTSVPTWNRRASLLSPLFVASAVSSGLSAVSGAVRAGGEAAGKAERRLARAEAIALSAELGLAIADRARARSALPSARHEPPTLRAARWLTFAAGVAAPLAVRAVEGFGRGRRRSRGTLLAAGLAVAGSLAMRLLITHEGRRSADTPADTWVNARLDEERGSVSGEGVVSMDGEGWEA